MFFRKHLKKLRARSRARVILASSTALQVLYLYAGQPKHFEKWFGRFIRDDEKRELYSHIYERMFAYGAFFVLPAGIVKLVLWERLRDYGLQAGKLWKGVPILGVSIPAFTFAGWYAAQNPEFQAEYPLSETARKGGRDLLLYEIANFHYYIGWEFFYRGYLQHGLEESFGVEGATAFQTMASTLMHIGKPRDETVGAVVAGPLFGWMARTTESVYYPLLAHWWLGLMTDLFCLNQAQRPSARVVSRAPAGAEKSEAPREEPKPVVSRAGTKRVVRKRVAPKAVKKTAAPRKKPKKSPSE